MNHEEVFAQVNRCLQEGRLDEAEETCRRIERSCPGLPRAIHSLGVVDYYRGNLGKALELVEQAISLQPDYVNAFNTLGLICLGLGKATEAAAAFEKALQLKPEFANALNGLGLAFHEQGMLGKAEENYRKGLAQNPDYAEAHNNLGTLLTDQGKLAAAEAHCRKALEINPEFAEAHNNLGNICKEQGRHREALGCYRRALILRPDHALIHSNLILTMNYLPDCTLQEIYQESLRWGSIHGTPVRVRQQRFKNNADPARRLRIGYVSRDFRRHTVGHHLRPVLECHDHGQVEVFCYSGVTVEDDFSQKFRHCADVWQTTTGVGDQDLAHIIRKDRIDILVDLAGHTAENRLTLFAARPAPVQVSWLGYWNTTGLSAMDYLISDIDTILPGEDRNFTEQVVRLPRSRFCYAPPVYAPPITPPPLLTSGQVTFGSFNNLAKVNVRSLSLWARLLRELPGSRLVLKWSSFADAATRDHYLRLFAEQGIETGRIDLRGWSPHEEMLAEYGEIDIALDPFPFSGGLTSCEALWMGVPLVTLRGKLPIGRQTAGFLHNVGLTNLIAETEEDYLAFAKSLASEPLRLEELRSGLRSRMAASPLCDGPGLARSLESAFREMWRVWCNDKIKKV